MQRHIRGRNGDSGKDSGSEHTNDVARPPRPCSKGDGTLATSGFETLSTNFHRCVRPADCPQSYLSTTTMPPFFRPKNCDGSGVPRQNLTASMLPRMFLSSVLDSKNISRWDDFWS